MVGVETSYTQSREFPGKKQQDNTHETTYLAQGLNKVRGGIGVGRGGVEVLKQRTDAEHTGSAGDASGPEIGPERYR